MLPEWTDLEYEGDRTEVRIRSSKRFLNAYEFPFHPLTS